MDEQTAEGSIGAGERKWLCMQHAGPHSTGRTGWKLVSNPGCQLVRVVAIGLESTLQLATK